MRRCFCSYKAESCIWSQRAVFSLHLCHRHPKWSCLWVLLFFWKDWDIRQFLLETAVISLLVFSYHCLEWALSKYILWYLGQYCSYFVQAYLLNLVIVPLEENVLCWEKRCLKHEANTAFASAPGSNNRLWTTKDDILQLICEWAIQDTL